MFYCEQNIGSYDLKVFSFSFYSNLKNIPAFPEFGLYNNNNNDILNKNI